MPAVVRRHSKSHKVGKKSFPNPHFHIVSPEKGTVGHSRTRNKAKASARIRTQKARK